MKDWKRNAIAAAMLSAMALMAGCGSSNDDDETPPVTETPAEPRPLELTILHINDQHSALDSSDRTLMLKDSTGTPTEVEIASAGMPRVKAAIDALAAESSNVITLHAGDALTGTLYFNRAGEAGQADAALMNTVCFDAMAVGNHEFDKGDAGLKGFIDFLHADTCKTPVLSANVQFGESSPLHGTGLVNPSTIIERDGQRIGIVGLTIATKTKQSSSPDATTTFSGETEAAQAQIDALRADGIDKVIVLSHIGYHYDKDVIARLSGVDVVVGGDSHSLLGPDTLETYDVGSPEGPYPTRLTDKDGKQVCLVQAWEYTKVLGELKVSFDANGDVTACEGTPHVLLGETVTVGGAAPSPEDLVAFQADLAAAGYLRQQAPDAGAEAVLQPFKDKVEVYSQSEVALVTQELCRRRVPGTGGDTSNSSAACNAEGKVAQRGGDIQQLVAQAYLDMANDSYGGADIALQNGGGVRQPLNPGRITAAQVIEVLPFGNVLWRMEVTGVEVKAMIEDGMDAVFRTGGTTGPYPYAGGLRWDADRTQAKGNRASNLEVLDQATNTWLPLDETRTYRLFLLSFLAGGGDGYTTLGNVPTDRREDIGALDADVFQAYIDKQPRDPGTGLPVLNRVADDLYSTKSFTE